jgi:hypothetical protein
LILFWGNTWSDKTSNQKRIGLEGTIKARFSEAGFESMKMGVFLLFGRTKRPDLHRTARPRFSPLSAGSPVLGNSSGCRSSRRQLWARQAGQVDHLGVVFGINSLAQAMPQSSWAASSAWGPRK